MGLSASATLNVALTTLFGIATFASVQAIRRAGLANWAAFLLLATMLVAAAMIVFWRYDSTRALSPFLQPDAISVTQRMLSDASWLGAGAGAFATLLPLYQDLGSSVTQPSSTMSALAIELGWPMALFAIATAIWLAVILYRGALDRGRDSFYPAAAAAGAVIVLGEAFCDASLRNSCIAVMISALMALGLAQTISSRDRL